MSTALVAVQGREQYAAEADEDTEEPPGGDLLAAEQDGGTEEREQRDRSAESSGDP